MRTRVCTLALALTLTVSGALAAKTNLNTRKFRPAVNGLGLLANESGDILGHLQWNVWLLNNYAHQPVRLSSNGSLTPLIRWRYNTDLGFAIGLFRWVELGLIVPATIIQQGNELDNTSQGLRYRGWRLGDVAFYPKVAILRKERHHVGMNFQLNVTFPTSDPRSWIGESNVTLQPMLNISYDELFYAGLNVGAIVRFSPTTVANITQSHEFVANLGLGYTFKKTVPRVTLMTELSTATRLTNFYQEKAESHLEWRGAVRFTVKGLQFLVGGGVGIGKGVGTPAVRAFVGIGYTNIRYDRDGDGIPDDKDKCPNDPEDKDGFEDQDGCPDPDNDKDGVCDPWVQQRGLLGKYATVCSGSDKCPNVAGPRENQGCPWGDRDGDGVLDNVDKCPTVPGPPDNGGCPWGDKDRDGVLDNVDKCPTVPGPPDNGGCPWGDRDKDGVPDNVDKCPDQPGPRENGGCPLARVEKGKIVIGQKIYFKTGSAKILPRSFGILAAVAKVLNENPSLRVRIEGHTDSRGSARANRGLSKRRARAVLSYLAKVHKIARKRLSSTGYGPDRPLITANTADAWARNRRVEFTILK